jgi:L-arabinose isomerase
MESKRKAVWFITGSQHLYGPETLRQVDADSRVITAGLGEALGNLVDWSHRPVVTTPNFLRKHGAAAYYGQG